MKLIECVPNFSEGRRANVIDALAQAARGVAGAALLDYSADADHNRSVFTLLGEPEAVAEAAFRMCGVARDYIDMTRHTGAHPRMGAADVVPFVPINGCCMRECADISRRFARRIYDELSIPCFLYGEACSDERRRDLAVIRRGGFEGMARKLLEDGWAPDFGPRGVHPTAGVTAVGARSQLVAFNVNLRTGDVRVAKNIAKKIRGSDGGFSFCKAIGVLLESKGAAQVSMNIVDFAGLQLNNNDSAEDFTSHIDFAGSPLLLVFEAIRVEAARFGVEIAGSELVGLAPAKAFHITAAPDRALVEATARCLLIENFKVDAQILDNFIPEVNI